MIPALNEEAFIEACLRSLIAQDFPHERLEVIVADGGSTDRTRAIIGGLATEAPFGLRVVENPQRTTPNGLNAGVAQARGDVIIILGAHSLASPTFVSASVEALRETGAAAAGGPIETRGDGLIAEAVAAALSHPFGVGDARFRFSKTPGYVDTIAFAAYRRECFDVLGGFDVTRDKAEDDFFNYCVRRAGGRLYLTPAVSSVYFARSSFRSVARQYFGYGQAKGRALMAEPGSVRPRHFAPLLAVLGGGAILLAAPWSARARLLAVAGTAGYAAAATFFGQRATSRKGDARLWPLTAATFPILHASYGLGTLLGILRSRRPRR